MNGVAYKMTELELASFLKARGHRSFSVRLGGHAVAFDFDGDTAPHVELRAPALTPERKSVLCLPAQHGAITANPFWGQGRKPLAVGCAGPEKRTGSFMSAKLARRCSLSQGAQSSAVLSIWVSNCLPRGLFEAQRSLPALIQRLREQETQGNTLEKLYGTTSEWVGETFAPLKEEKSENEKEPAKSNQAFSDWASGDCASGRRRAEATSD